MTTTVKWALLVGAGWVAFIILFAWFIYRWFDVERTGTENDNRRIFTGSFARNLTEMSNEHVGPSKEDPTR